MKKSIALKFSVVFGLVFLTAVLGILNSCQKVSDMDHPGNDPGGPTGPGANEVYIQGNAFTPSTITVAANTTITWTNKDAASHTVTSTGGAFNSGTISTNGTFSFTFTMAGTYPYYCTVHPSMTGSVTVN